MAAIPEDHWQRARLFPITGIGGDVEQERRATSALLAVVGAVRELGAWIGAMIGAPGSASPETYIEVHFPLGGKTLAPDGLVRFTYGKRSWTALVEVKTEHNRLGAAQVQHYLDIAYARSFDAVITVSHEIPTTPGIHPLAPSRPKLHGLKLLHLSWTQIRTEMSIQQSKRAIADPDQAWLLGEYLRYLREPKAGASDFDDMGPSWVAVRDAALHDTLVAKSSATDDVVRRFDQLISFTASSLARKVHVDVHPNFSEKTVEEENHRIERAASALAETKRLTGSLDVRGAVAPIIVVADLSARRVRASLTVSAPKFGRPTTKLNWLLRQLQSAPNDLSVSARVAHAKEPGESRQLKVLHAEPKHIVNDPKADIRSFTLTLDRPMGQKRGGGHGMFIDSVVGLVQTFYGDVVEHLKPWVAPAPKLVPSEGGSQDTEVPASISDTPLESPESAGETRAQTEP